MPALRAEGAADADLSRTLRDGREHDVHDPDTADQEADPRDGSEHDVEDALGLLTTQHEL